jgi:hypothetical protein
VPRRISLPGADELFGTTRAGQVTAGLVTAGEAEAGKTESEQDASVAHAASSVEVETRRTTPSGRVRHDEKITIYVTADELLTLEHTRLALRARHGVAVDRGRVVREAIHLALQDVADHGDASALVRRLREQ